MIYTKSQEAFKNLLGGTIKVYECFLGLGDAIPAFFLCMALCLSHSAPAASGQRGRSCASGKTVKLVVRIFLWGVLIVEGAAAAVPAMYLFLIFSNWQRPLFTDASSRLRNENAQNSPEIVRVRWWKPALPCVRMMQGR